ncbi:MAG: ACT domain-containing protein [Eubacterium sp.]|nr:ACT domain-containing protein [Eubacterium sp.]
MENNVLKKSIITVVGVDAVGIIAKVSSYLASNNINILDINQTITGGFFNMMMVVESDEKTKTFPDMAAELDQIGEEIGMRIQVQRAEIFEMMHRI